MSETPQEIAQLNRRKPENRWQRIHQDADKDQYQTVRRWLKFAQHLIGKDEKDPDDDPGSAAA